MVDCTDDATLVENLGHTVAVVDGEYTNIKITSSDDVIFATALLQGEGIA